MSIYPIRLRVFTGVAVLHLVLVALSASYVGFTWTGPLQGVLDYYGAASGADSSYGFFAPGIFNQLRALFEITDQDGKIRQVDLATGASKEADLRVGNIIDGFATDADDTVAFQRSLSSSLAGTIFGRYPEATKVKVKLETFVPVSMEDYRNGKRAHWDSVYSAQYAISPGTVR